MASTYLTRTVPSDGNRKIWTWSAWVKGQPTTPTNSMSGQTLFSVGTSVQNRTHWFISDGYFTFRNEISDTQLRLITNRTFTDPNGWYHLVLAVDTTQSTASNRVKLYVNGEQVTSFSTEEYPNQNDDTFVNNNQEHRIGSASWSSSSYWDGLMTHLHFIDGTQYAASAFGETDTTTGEWKAKTSPSVTYGTNGFFIFKDGNGITDQSGEGNDFTLGGGTLTDLKDNPDNVFATLNPLATSSYTTLSKGNTESLGGTSDNGNTFSTLAPNSGKYYVESKIATESSGYPYVGVKQINTPEFGRLLNSTSGLAGYSNTSEASYKLNGQKYSNNGVSSFGDTFVSGDIVSLAIDCDNGACYASRNGVWQNSGDPTSGANKTGALVTWTPADSDGVAFAVADYNNSKTQTNFGNGYFGTTAITTNSGNGYSGAEGSSKFNYTVPTGYSALSTKGLNE